jgi:type II secretory pathway predicted ATPase ExeA
MSFSKDNLAKQKKKFDPKKRIFPEKFQEDKETIQSIDIESDELKDVFEQEEKEVLVSDGEKRELRTVFEEIYEENSIVQTPKPQDAFKDVVDPYKYIELDSNALAFTRIHKVLNENLKMSVIYGVPGSGKSMFISRLHNDLLALNRVSILIASPILNGKQLFQFISSVVFKKNPPNTFDELRERIVFSKELSGKKKPIILLDEAQLYSNATLEKLRILSDTQKLRVIFVLHKLKQEDIFSQEHFQSRIWEKIELKNATSSELKNYIQKKLIGASMLSLAKQFSSRIVRRIHSITEGNYRATNNLLYTYFSKYPEIYSSDPIGSKPKMRVKAREIEIVAIQIGFIKVEISNSTDLRHTPTAEAVWRKWKRKEYIRYLSFLILPTLIYVAYAKYIEYEDKIQVDIVNPTKIAITEELPKIVEEYLEKEIIKLEQKKEEEVVKKLEEPIQIEEEDFSFVRKLIDKDRKLEVIRNVEIDSLNLDDTPFQKRLQITPIVTYFNSHRLKVILNQEEERENEYISSLQKEYLKDGEIDTLLKILNFYKAEKNYYEIYKYSLELNKIDVSYKEPYLNLHEILKNEVTSKKIEPTVKYFEKEKLEDILNFTESIFISPSEAEKVLNSCRNCE